MDRQTSSVLHLYRKLLKLYPTSYRQEYEDEMVDTMQVMLNDTTSYTAKLCLLWRACKDYATSLTQQNVLALENTASEAPTYIRQSSKFSTSLVMPFFIICSYNLLNQYILHHQIPYVGLEAKTWIIYCIIMPILAALVIAFAMTRSLIDNVRHQRIMASEWLLLGIPLSLLIALILM